MSLKKFAVIWFAVMMSWSICGRADEIDKDAEDNITFVVVGDTRVATPGAPIPEAYKRILEESNLIAPDFIFHTGDVIFGYGDSEHQVKTEYSNVDQVHALVNSRIYFVPGNHDYNTAHIIKLFKEMSDQTRDYFSFDYHGAGFIVLNTEIPGQVGKVTGDQWDWFVEELEARKDYPEVFVFMHRPLFYPNKLAVSKHGKPVGLKKYWESEKNRVDLIQLMLKYKVDAVMAGHAHLYFRTDYKGLPFLTIGGGGATFSAPVETGGFFHYLVVTVRGKKTTLNLMEPYQLSVNINYLTKDGKSYGEAVIHNFHGELDKGMVPLRGIKFTLPKGKYSVKAEGIVSEATMTEAAEFVLDLDDYGKDSREQSEKIKALMAGYLKPTIYRVSPNPEKKEMIDLWVSLDMPGTFPVRVTVSPE